MVTDSPVEKLTLMASMSNSMYGMAQTIRQYAGYLPEEDRSMADEIVAAAEDLVAEFRSMFASGVLPIEDDKITREARHDLRNKITAVQGFSDLLLMGDPEPDALRDQLQSLSSQARDFTHLTVPDMVA
jgi:signal transduction histidine kinase